MESKETKSPTVKAPYFIINELLSHLPHSREPSRGIRKKLDDWEKKLTEGLGGAQAEHQKVQAFYALDELKEGQTIPKEAIKELNAIYIKESELTVDDSRFLTEKEFDLCFPYEDNRLSRGDRKKLEFWAVIEEKEG